MQFQRIAVAALATGVWLGAASPSKIPVPEVVRVPAGAFLMGSEEGASWEKPVHKVDVSEFSIGRRPVSNREFRAFRPNHHSSGDDSGDAPVTGISWEDARQYCRWLSQRTGKKYRLPTEAEWEKAARGGLEQKKYPWGDEPPVPEDKLNDEDFEPQLRPNGYGMIAGSTLWEWTADWYDADYYERSPAKDPRGPKDGIFRTLRGGGYRTDPNSMRCANRGSSRPKATSDIITFRVVLEHAPPQITESRPPAATRPPSQPPSQPRGGSISLTGIDIGGDGGQVTVSLATDAPAQYRTMVLKGPDRLVIDLPGTVVRTAGSSLDVNRGGVRRIRWAQFKRTPPVARVVVDMEGRLDFKIDSQGNELMVRLKR